MAWFVTRQGFTLCWSFLHSHRSQFINIPFSSSRWFQLKILTPSIWFKGQNQTRHSKGTIRILNHFLCHIPLRYGWLLSGAVRHTYIPVQCFGYRPGSGRYEHCRPLTVNCKLYDSVERNCLPGYDVMSNNCNVVQIPGARLPGRLNFVPLRLIIVDPQHGTCCVSPFWRVEF